MTDTATRTADLKHLLIERRRELQDHVQHHIRDGRTARAPEGCDDLEHSEADIQEDLAFALLQMRTETLARIADALGQLDAGQYGSCSECDRDIAERRLRALPFAVRCQACEERREQAHAHARQQVRRHCSLSAGPNLVTA